uniref:Replication-associated protein n=1 Tax=Eragrostis minor streak virus TaxID=1030595 RepID=A0A1B0PN48_9GEMI|nr:RepA [Eragrostis minor streak virus]
MSQDQDTLGSSSDGSRFRISSKQLFLTYPKCDLSPKDLGLELLQLLIQNKPKYIHVTQELHKDGFPHLHALVQLEKKLFTRRQTFFDQFLHGTKFHPNIQPARDASKVLGYITKQNGEEYIFGKPTLPKKKKTAQEGRDQRMRAIIESSTSKQEYLSMVRKEFPFDWATRLMQFEYSASSLFPEPPVEYTSPFPVDQLLCPEDITEIINSEWFQVTPYSYTLIHPGTSISQAADDLQQMQDISMEHQEAGHVASTSVDQPVLERRLGLEA